MTAAKAKKPDLPADRRESRRDPLAPVCVIDGCTEPVLHRGLCAAHWEDPQQR